MGYLSPVVNLDFSQSKHVIFFLASGIVPNELGKVLRPGAKEEGTDKFLPGVYVCGWLKRGPSGIIGTNLLDAKETVS